MPKPSSIRSGGGFFHITWHARVFHHACSSHQDNLQQRQPLEHQAVANTQLPQLLQEEGIKTPMLLNVAACFSVVWAPCDIQREHASHQTKSRKGGRVPSPFSTLGGR
ncbi:unnamed protein product [Effrenium voratum]|nr:unnamed protein product [Effrenium voratum]